MRYRRGDSIVRAQLRWFGLIAVVVVIAFVLATLLAENGEVFFGIGVTAIACLPITIGVAITRYRLYDIDLIINRAIVYGTLTAILAGIFTAGVGLGQRLFVAFTGESSGRGHRARETLVVATLYAPLRKRIEAVIDKRFKYDTRRFGPYAEESSVRARRHRPGPRRGEARGRGGLGAWRHGRRRGRCIRCGARNRGDLARGERRAADAHRPRRRGPIRAILVGPGRGGRAHAAADLAALEEVGRLVASSVLLPAAPRALPRHRGAA